MPPKLLPGRAKARKIKFSHLTGEYGHRTFSPLILPGRQEAARFSGQDAGNHGRLARRRAGGKERSLEFFRQSEGEAAGNPARLAGGKVFAVPRVKPPADRRDFPRTHRDGATPRQIRFAQAGTALREPQPRRISRYSRSKREVSARNQTA